MNKPLKHSIKVLIRDVQVIKKITSKSVFFNDHVFSAKRVHPNYFRDHKSFEVMVKNYDDFFLLKEYLNLLEKFKKAYDKAKDFLPIKCFELWHKEANKKIELCDEMMQIKEIIAMVKTLERIPRIAQHPSWHA
jgi:hypothetical protein